MLQIRTSSAPRGAVTRSGRQTWVGLATQKKNVALAGAACAYVGVGYAAFQVTCAITGDTDLANWIVAGLSVPLAAPLFYAVGWIEEHL